MIKQRGVKPMLNNIPKMLTIRQTAETGILPEHALRKMVKENRVPHIMVGSKALINFNLLCEQLNNLQEQ